MKRLLLLFMGFICIGGQLSAQTPFNKGVNLTGWFQADGPGQIQFTMFTKKDFENIKSLGCDVVRLPINLHAMTGAAPAYSLNPLFLSFLDQAVDWSEDLGLHLILDNHSFDPAVNTSTNVGSILTKVWKQMAAHYNDRSDLIYYEILNEPHGISEQNWSKIQGDVIAAIREVDTKHAIIVGGADWNSYNTLSNLPVYNDDNLIYTFHFYDPFLFTHQGASWSDPSMEPLANVPFPYDAPKMPSCPQSLKNTWIEDAMNNYANEGTEARIRQLIDVAAEFKNTRNARIFCGEFGVLMNNSDNDDRVYWYETTRKYLEQKGIAWTIWDYAGSFGIFENGGFDLFDYDLNIPMLAALGLHTPEQKEYMIEPEGEGFMIYSDYVGQGMTQSGYGGSVDYYSKDRPNNGEYCLRWSGAQQYASIGFDFKPDRDLSLLVENGYALDFILRGDTPGATFDVRFLDTKTGQNDHPWRMRFTTTEGAEPWNGKWRHVRIPLTSFAEQGSWDEDAWHNPEGKFDWKAVDRFEIVAENSSLEDAQFWFDNIYVTDQDTALAYDRIPLAVEAPVDAAFTISCWPNPFSGDAIIDYRLKEKGDVTIELFHSSGRRIETLLKQVKPAGTHTLYLSGVDKRMKEGLYLCRMVVNGVSRTIKIAFTR